MLSKAFRIWLSFSFLLVTSSAMAESVDDPLSKMGSDSGAVHGLSFGKPMMRILIFGAVPGQGVHYMPEGTDLLFALLYAGGYGDRTRLNGISIRRRTQSEIINVDLEDILGEGKSIPKLLDGDIVNVPFNWRKAFEELSFLTGVLSAVSALILAIVAVRR